MTDNLKVELKLFGEMCSSTYVADNVEAHLNIFLKKYLIDSFDNIHFIFDIFLPIPMSSASTELSLSILRCLKTFTRNTIDQERFGNIVILHTD